MADTKITIKILQSYPQKWTEFLFEFILKIYNILLFCILNKFCGI